jgi:hypothetical protein
MGAGLILMLRVEVADWDEGRVESVTLMVSDDVPIEFCAGLPVMEMPRISCTQR